MIPFAQVTTISNEGRNPVLGSSRAPDSIDRRNTETTTSCSGVLGMGSVGSGSDLRSEGNKAIKKGKELVPKIMEKE